VTLFDIRRHHIYIEPELIDVKGLRYSVTGILDTGAPKTEFSDQFLVHTGFIESAAESIIKPGLQTQKYRRITLPSVMICGHKIDRFDVFVSRFEKSWGIDALIGLDFFRRFMITVDYSKGFLITAPYTEVTDR
jgi:hypothetical protein